MHANSPGASTEGTPEENEKRKKRGKELTWDGGWGEKSELAAEDIRGREASVGWCRWFCSRWKTAIKIGGMCNPHRSNGRSNDTRGG